MDARGEGGAEPSTGSAEATEDVGGAKAEEDPGGGEAEDDAGGADGADGANAFELYWLIVLPKRPPGRVFIALVMLDDS